MAGGSLVYVPMPPPAARYTLRKLPGNDELVPILATVPSKVTLARLVHCWNAKSEIDVTPVPMVTLVRPVQLPNAKPRIDVTLLGMVTLVRLVLANAYSPIDVTLLGMMTLARLLHCQNA